MGVWSKDSMDCSGEEVHSLKSGRPNKNTCEKCYNFDSIQVVCTYMIEFGEWWMSYMLRNSFP